jgi:hypothetical protein
MAATLEIHFLTLKYTQCQFCQNYPKKVAKIKLILAKLAFATDYEACTIVIRIDNEVQGTLTIVHSLALEIKSNEF